MRPGPGRCCWMAIIGAASSARMWSRMARPMIVLAARLSTAAEWGQPSPAAMVVMSAGRTPVGAGALRRCFRRFGATTRGWRPLVVQGRCRPSARARMRCRRMSRPTRPWLHRWPWAQHTPHEREGCHVGPWWRASIRRTSLASGRFAAARGLSERARLASHPRDAASSPRPTRRDRGSVPHAARQRQTSPRHLAPQRAHQGRPSRQEGSRPPLASVADARPGHGAGTLATAGAARPGHPPRHAHAGWPSAPQAVTPAWAPLPWASGSHGTLPSGAAGPGGTMAFPLRAGAISTELKPFFMADRVYPDTRICSDGWVCTWSS